MPSQWVLLNGDLLEAENASVSIFDRSFMYGDGIYTTMKVTTGRVVFLDRHFDRLRRHMTRLSLGQPKWSFDLGDAVKQLIKKNNMTDGLVRLTISRGTKLILPSLEPIDPVIVGVADSMSFSFLSPGIAVITVPEARDGFRDVKTVNRLVTLMALRDAVVAGADEAIFVSGGNLIEGTCHNIIEGRSGCYVTPDLQGRGMSGIVREILIEELGCQISEISKDTRGPLFVTNCLIGVRPVNSLNGISLEQDTRALQVLESALSNVEAREM